MIAGDLKHPVTLLRPLTTVNEKGRKITAWEQVVQVHAARQDVSGREFFAAMAIHAENIVSYTIRYRATVDATWRLSHHGTVYEIVEVNHLGEKRDYMRLKCRAVAGEG